MAGYDDRPRVGVIRVPDRGARVGDSPRSRPRRRCGPARRGSSQCSHTSCWKSSPARRELHLESPSRARKVSLSCSTASRRLGRFTLRSGSSSWAMYVDDAFVGATTSTRRRGISRSPRKDLWPLLLERCQTTHGFHFVTIGRSRSRGSKKGSNDRVSSEGFSRAAKTKYENCAIQESRAGETRSP